jgi:hypothetical protein
MLPPDGGCFPPNRGGKALVSSFMSDTVWGILTSVSWIKRNYSTKVLSFQG